VTKRQRQSANSKNGKRRRENGEGKQGEGKQEKGERKQESEMGKEKEKVFRSQRCKFSIGHLSSGKRKKE